MVDEVTAAYVTAATSDGYPEEWDLEKLWRALKQLYPIRLTIDAVVEEAGGDKSGLTTDLLTDMVTEDAQAAYDRREEELTSEIMRELERRVVLSVLDRKWREHLYEMDYLREGIGLRAMAQRDPLVEYQREGYDMFNAMMDGIKEESVAQLFNLQVEIQENPIVEEAQDVVPGMLFGPQAPAGNAQAAGAPALAGAPGQAAQAGGDAPATARPGKHRRRPGTADGADHATAAGRGQTATRSGGQPGSGAQSGPQLPRGLAPRRPSHLEYTAPSDSGGVEHHSDAVEESFAGVNRNDPCPCGSGRKFKRCHGDPRNATS
jgi:preprotein translocase subunit SecA